MKTTISPSSMLSCVYWYFSLIFCHELSLSNLHTIFFFFNWHKSSIWTGLCTSSVRPPPGWFGEGWGNAFPRCLKASLQCGRGALTERDQKQPVSYGMARGSATSLLPYLNSGAKEPVQIQEEEQEHKVWWWVGEGSAAITKPHNLPLKKAN